MEHWQGVIVKVVCQLYYKFHPKAVTKMGSISQINEWNVPQTAGEHLNTHVIHLQGLPGQWNYSGNSSVLFVQWCSFFCSHCLETEAQQEQEEPPLVYAVSFKSKTSSLQTWAFDELLYLRCWDVQHVVWHWALVCCFSDAKWDSLNAAHPWPLSQS